MRNLLVGLLLAILSVGFIADQVDARDRRVPIAAAGGGGETLVYGPQAFTAADDTLLETFTGWAKMSSGALAVFGNAIVAELDGGGGWYRWTTSALTDQKVCADIFTNNASNYPGLIVRHNASTTTSATFYLAEMDAGENKVIFYRVTAGPTYTEVARGGAVAIETTYSSACFKAVGTNPVQLQWDDATNGTAAVTYSDSNAARLTSGQPGLSNFTVSPRANGSSIDNLSIYSIP